MLLQLFIPLVTWSVVNVTADVYDFRLISLDTSGVSREGACLPWFDVVNCLLKWSEIYYYLYLALFTLCFNCTFHRLI